MLGGTLPNGLEGGQVRRPNFETYHDGNEMRIILLLILSYIDQTRMSSNHGISIRIAEEPENPL